MVDRFARLRHDAVVGRDDEHDDVGDLGAAGAHQGERLVTGRVEEHDAAAVADVDVIGADVLRDAAGFALGDLRFADRVEQRRLAVVDVTHDGDDRRARADDPRDCDSSRLGRDELLLEAAHLDLGAELAREVLGGVDVERAVDGHHHPLHQQLGEHVLDAHVELVGEILDRHAFGERDRARDRRRRRRRAGIVGAGRTLAARRDRTLAGPVLLAANGGRGRHAGPLAGHARTRRRAWLSADAPAARAADAVRPACRASSDAAAADNRARPRRARLDAARPVLRAARAPACAGLAAGGVARRRLHHPRLRHGGTLRRRQRPRRRRRPSGFLDAQPQRRRHEAAGGVGRRRCGRRWRRRPPRAAAPAATGSAASSTAAARRDGRRGDRATRLGNVLRRRGSGGAAVRRPADGGISLGRGSSATGSGSPVRAPACGASSTPARMRRRLDRLDRGAAGPAPARPASAARPSSPAPAFFAVPALAGPRPCSANMSPPGSEMLRWRATRSTNDRATTSSTVLDALFSSMP